MKKGSYCTPWTAEEHQRLLDMVTGGYKWPAIAEAIPGRSESACKERYRDWESRQFIETGRGRDRGRTFNQTAIAKVALARELRASLPGRSLTAEFCGDPLPGRSALDRRQAAPEIRSISLAGGGL